VIEDEVLVGQNPTVLVTHQCTGIKIEALSIGGSHVPVQADGDGGQAGRLLDEADIATFFQAYYHDSSNGWRWSRSSDDGPDSSDDYVPDGRLTAHRMRPDVNVPTARLLHGANPH
jgi:hypothetical protein